MHPYKHKGHIYDLNHSLGHNLDHSLGHFLGNYQDCVLDIVPDHNLGRDLEIGSDTTYCWYVSLFNLVILGLDTVENIHTSRFVKTNDV